MKDIGETRRENARVRARLTNDMHVCEKKKQKKKKKQNNNCVLCHIVRFTERRGKKTVRFDGGTNVGGGPQEDWSWEADRQGSQDSATKDSGIDTSSTFTSSEDSNRGDLPKVRRGLTFYS